jgi:hypothetical protein
MTAPAKQAVDLTEFEEDVAEPCIAKRCDTPAEWVAEFIHGYETCPEEWYLCTAHKDVVMQAVVEGIRKGDGVCPRCCPRKRMFGGKPSDFVNFYPLR